MSRIRRLLRWLFSLDVLEKQAQCKHELVDRYGTCKACEYETDPHLGW